MSYDTYIIWMRLTHNGRRSRSDMPPADQAEYDALKVTQAPAPDYEEAKRAYEEVTRRSDLGSGPSA